jgi:hypothetical protein
MAFHARERCRWIKRYQLWQAALAEIAPIAKS